MSYAIKYASAFYGPFREAAEGAPQFGDRKTHQMDPANAREALRELALDIDEGADMVMVKPAMPYLDVIRDVVDEVLLPVAAYQVSGEYSQIWAAGERGWIDLDGAMLESLSSIHRAGADLIITSRSRSRLELFGDEVESLGRRAVPLELDVTDHDSIQAAVGLRLRPMVGSTSSSTTPAATGASPLSRSPGMIGTPFWTPTCAGHSS